MRKPGFLTEQDIIQTLNQAKDDKIKLNISYRISERWKTARGNVCSLSDNFFEIRTLEECINCAEILKIDQPVGISFKMQHFRYLLESKVVSCNCGNRAVKLELPEKIEERPRRSYVRVAVPESMIVNVIFWHRGYDDDKDYVPKENIWQGKLENISAGGMKILIPSEKKDFFSPGQLIGLQFTPMPYEKPILLEGLVRHLEQQDRQCEIGVEFLGLEASWQGREKIDRLIEVTEKYDSIQNSPIDPEQQHED